MPGDRPEKDQLYARGLDRVDDFVFDERVARVFPDMLQRSIPGYGAIVSMIGLLAEKHAQPGSRLYDLGCSLGAATAAMRAALPGSDCRIVAVDKSQAMLDHAMQQLNPEDRPPVELHCCDIRDVEIADASVVVLNFTLQFIPVAERLSLLEKIRSGLRPGGILVLSEKIAGATPAEDAQLIEMHHAFKAANGYSALEISQKRQALENILIPERVDTHQERLSAAGFSQSMLWFQCFNFASLVAYA